MELLMLKHSCVYVYVRVCVCVLTVKMENSSLAPRNMKQEIFIPKKEVS